MPFGLGFFATAGVSAAAGSYELISSTILTGSQASVTFSNLGDYSSTYQHLQMRWVARSNRGFAADLARFDLNGDTTDANYAYHWLAGSGSAVNSGGEANQPAWLTYVAAANETANAFSVGVTDILDPYESKNKTLRTFFTGGDDRKIVLQSNLWKSTNSLTSITFKPVAGTAWVQYSRFSLYGIKG